MVSLCDRKVVPWEPETHCSAGWLVKTYIAESKIDGAGRGRFADQRIAAGDYIRHVRVITIDETTPLDHTFLHCPDKILQMMTPNAYNMVADGYGSADEQKLADFIFADPNHNGALVYTSGCVFNHSIGANVMGEAISNHWGTVVAKCAIAKGEELICDYNDYCIPLDIRAAIIARGAFDVQTLLDKKGSSMFH